MPHDYGCTGEVEQDLGAEYMAYRHENPTNQGFWNLRAFEAECRILVLILYYTILYYTI